MADARPVIVISCKVHFPVIDLLAPHGELRLNQTAEALTPEELRTRCRDADALLAFMCDRIDDEFLEACPRLRIVAGALKGFDNIDVEAATRRGVWIANVPGHLTGPTAELAVALLLGLARKIAVGDRQVRQGQFTGWRPILYGTSLAGTRVGIVGMGVIGEAIARRLAAFETILRYHDARSLPPEREHALGMSGVPLDDLTGWADALVLCLPLTPQTRHLFDRDRLGRMRPDALLVNIGRGSVVDEAALAEALAAGRLGGYAADVFALEDLSLSDRPITVPSALLHETDRTLFTPHLGSAVGAVRVAIELEAAENILDSLHGGTPRGAIGGGEK